MAIPKYQQIKQSLLYEIKNGKFLPGDKFYSESELKSKFNVSSITAVKALGCLTNEGYLVRYQGKGTYVSKAKRGKIVKFSDREKYQDGQERTEVLSIDQIRSKEIARELKIPDQEEFYHIKRVRYVDEVPVLIQNSFLIQEFIKPEDAAHPERFSSIYTKIREDFGIDMFQADSKEITEIVYPIPEEERQLLQLEPGSPAAFTKRYTYLFDGRTIEYIEVYKRWDYFSIEIEPV